MSRAAAPHQHGPDTDVSDLRALFLDCTLGPSPEPSHTRGLFDVSPSIMEPPDLAQMLRDRGGVPAHGNRRDPWDAGRRFDHPNPEYR